MKKNFLVMIFGLACLTSFTGCGKSEDVSMEWIKDKVVVIKAEYPESIGFDDYDSKREVREQNPVDDDFIQAINDFTYHSSAELFGDIDPLSNRMYSPMSLHMALSLAASGAKGNTQKEILKGLQMEKYRMNQVEEQTGNLFRKLFTSNEIGKLQLANSLWLSKNIQFKEAFLETSKDNYYSSVFSVDFADPQTGELMSAWIAEQSKGTLERSATVDQDQIMALINTIYFYDEWTNRFSESQTKPDVFTKYDGSEVKCDFMNAKYMSQGFVRGKGFVSSSLGFKNNGRMTFYLPDEDTNIYELVASPEKLQKLLDRNHPNNEYKMGEVVFKVPKFNFDSSLELKDMLQTLGIEEAFKEQANFNGMTEDTMAYISDIKQATHISINEKGCEASAYTEIGYAGAALPEDNAEMILDRPFLFTIQKNDVVLFIGIINDPTN